MKDLDDLLKRITGKGDLAAVGFGYVIFYLLDLKWAIAGLAPGTASFLGAFAALSFKNGVEAFWDRLHPGAQQDGVARRLHGGLHDAASKVQYLEIEEPWKRWMEEPRRQFEVDRSLWEKHLISDEEFQASIRQFTSQYRNVLRSSREEASGAAPGVVVRRV
jgi:hypothetical protein